MKCDGDCDNEESISNNIDVILTSVTVVIMAAMVLADRLETNNIKSNIMVTKRISLCYDVIT